MGGYLSDTPELSLLARNFIYPSASSAAQISRVMFSLWLIVLFNWGNSKVSGFASMHVTEQHNLKTKYTKAQTWELRVIKPQLFWSRGN